MGFNQIYCILQNNAAHQEALKREIERLRQVYHQQNLKKTENGAPQSQPHSDAKASIDKEQLLHVWLSLPQTPSRKSKYKKISLIFLGVL